MTDQDKILAFIRSTGPVLPAKVAKNLGTNILIASAHLSDLRSQGKIKISKLKVGGSPLYFLAGQEDKLYPFAAGNINQKDLFVLDRLKSARVLREQDLDLLGKVALRSLPDFAIPLHVTVHGKKEVFWRWHLLSDEETNNAIHDILTSTVQEIQTHQSTPQEQVALAPAPLSALSASSATQATQVVQTIRAAQATQITRTTKATKATTEIFESQDELGESSSSAEHTKQSTSQDSQSSQDSQEESVQFKKETTSQEPIATQRSEQTTLEAPVNDPVEEKEVANEAVSHKTEQRTTRSTQRAETTQAQQEDPTTKNTSQKPAVKSTSKLNEASESKKPILQKIREKVRKKRTLTPDKFLPSIKDFFVTLNIELEDHEVVRKNSEINLIVKVPSVVGKMKYYCKAKSKKRCDEKDLSAAYMEARIKKLPLLFLYESELSKKAWEMLETDAFENAVVKKIE